MALKEPAIDVILKGRLHRLEVVHETELARVLAVGTKKLRGAYASAPVVVAKVLAIHSYGCRATVLGKRSGPCNCGADRLFDAVVR